MSIDLGSQQLAMQNKQPTPAEPISTNRGSQKLSISNKRMTQVIPLLTNPSSQKNSTPNKRVTQVSSTPKNQGSRQSSLTTKRMSRSETMPSNPGSQQSPASNKRNPEPSPKGHAESSDSVRAKLRESLADSLSLVCKQENQAIGEKSEDKAASILKTCSGNPSLPDATASNSDDAAHKASSSLTSSQEVLATDSKEDGAPNLKCDTQDFQYNYVFLDDDVPFGNGLFVKDELLQENGLCWASDLEIQASQSEEFHSAKRPKLIHEEIVQPSSQDLATRIEAELFKIHGGVNKKYKEKGRSLLFNLKDRSNPELRERVMSGEITPERLCSMTAEELASKELSEWRIAKAEEFEHMVVLPDTDVDMRRLVKKTHKGEFQVEFEQDDAVSVEVAVGSTSLPQSRPKDDKKEAHALSRASEARRHAKNRLTTLPDDGADLMQGLMVDEMKDEEFLPPIVSLDEFMDSLDNEPPFENVPSDSETAIVNSDVDIPDVASKLDSPGLESVHAEDTTSDKPEKAQVKLSGMDTDMKSDRTEGETEVLTTVCTSKHDSKPNHVNRDLEISTNFATPKPDHVWEGLLQLNVSSVVTVIGDFKSGERTSAKEWTGFLDVKGRVRLDAFEKFLQELPMSRSRAIMMVHFFWKEGTPESGKTNLSEVVDSYVADDRVGFAEPAPGVELYLCPPKGKTSQMLQKHLSNDHMETLKSINHGLIGIVVWRKPHISPNSNSHKRKHKHQESKISKPQPDKEEEEDDDDDLPPGFGPGTAKEEDDLPEFDFSTRPPSVRQVDQVRNLIHKYGQGGGTGRVVVDDDDDDIPEWQPQSLNQTLPPPPPPPPLLQQLPPPPPPPPMMMQNFQQFPPQMFNQNQQFPMMQQQFLPPLERPMLMQPMNMNVMQQWPPQMVVPFNGVVPNFVGQPFVIPYQNGGEWRTDVNNNNGNRGF